MAYRLGSPKASQPGCHLKVATNVSYDFHFKWVKGRPSRTAEYLLIATQAYGQRIWVSNGPDSGDANARRLDHLLVAVVMGGTGWNPVANPAADRFV
jgi:hypothetical protein